MNFLRSRSITKRSVLTVLLAGFSLVIFLLLAASAVSFRNTRFIQERVSRLVREQLVITRLIKEIQLQQATLNEVYYELAHGAESLDRPTVTRQLQESNQALERIVKAAEGTPEERRVAATERAGGAVLRAVLQPDGAEPPSAGGYRDLAGHA